jgi:hypothetical protein
MVAWGRSPSILIQVVLLLMFENPVGGLLLAVQRLARDIPDSVEKGSAQ